MRYNNFSKIYEKVFGSTTVNDHLNRVINDFVNLIDRSFNIKLNLVLGFYPGDSVFVFKDKRNNFNAVIVISDRYTSISDLGELDDKLLFELAVYLFEILSNENKIYVILRYLHYSIKTYSTYLPRIDNYEKYKSDKEKKYNKIWSFSKFLVENFNKSNELTKTTEIPNYISNDPKVFEKFGVSFSKLNNFKE